MQSVPSVERVVARGRLSTVASRGMRVGWILVLVACVPMLGLAVVTYRSIRATNELATTTELTVAAAERATALAKLEGAIFEEMLWLGIGDIMGEIGVPAPMVASMLDAVPADEAVRVRNETDESIRSLELDDFIPHLDDARRDDSTFATRLSDYGALSADLQHRVDTALDDLDSFASEIDDRSVFDAARLLRNTVSLRRSVTDGFFGYFASTFAIRDLPIEEFPRLVAARERYDLAYAELQGAVTTWPALRPGLRAVDNSTQLQDFVTEIDQLVATTLVEGVPPEGAEVTLQAALTNIESFATMFAAATTSISLATNVLLDASSQEVLGATSAVSTAAGRDIRLAYGLAAILSLATVLAALLATRNIVRPLGRLQEAADGLRADVPIDDARIGGPAEVRAAALALRETTGHFDLVTRQARALAAGDLDAQVLDERAAGGLGKAVQHAVATLRSALTQQEEFRRRLAHEAAHDGLTKLPNRSASMAQLSRSLARTRRSGAQVAVLFIDLDHFKDVNDHHGHQAGDTVLTTVAKRLVNSVREGDHVGRLGGDEFVVVAEPVEGIDAAVGVAERIIEALEEPIDLPNVKVTIGASIGIAISDDPRLSADELLRDADLAVYRVKAVGRGGIEVCDEALRDEVAHTADLSVAISRAITENELILHYQSIVDSNGAEVHAFEALVRWQRPGEPHLVPPDEFIGFAERSSLIIDLDRWVLRAVARQIAIWRADGRFVGIPVAINVSGRHLGHPDLTRHVLDPLDEFGVDPAEIIIEVTESALLDDLATAATKLNELRAAGVRVSIDDFGTGYTSLAHLRTLPFDILKIDRSFTMSAGTSEHEASIVKLIIDTGHLLGAIITAEGVETTAEAAALTQLGSDHLQGYYYARPQAPDQLPAAGRPTGVTA